MCGLFGVIGSREVDLRLCREARDSLTHRGPDQAGEWWQADVYIGHRRLSILDLSEAGRQPMVAQDDKVIITVNGEIYNYRELRPQLQERHRFTSGSDSEVVLHGYREWGITGLLARLEGMYALAVYDAGERRLFLARDRVGVKPLYYGLIGDSFAWGSELKALDKYFGKDLNIDLTALYDFLTYRYIPSPKSLYREVSKLPPAHYLSYDCANRQVRIQRYWELKTDVVATDTKAAATNLTKLIHQAVKEQMVSDVPLGLFLSGGLDSTTVTAEALKVRKPVHSYCISFPGSEKDEAEYAAAAAAHLGSSHSKRACRDLDVGELLDRLPALYDEPFADHSALPTLLLCRFAREQVTVALSGDGGDEVFGGYKWYAGAEEPGPLRRRALLLADFMERHLGTHTRSTTRLRAFALTPALERHVKTSNRLLQREKRIYRKAWNIPSDYDDYWHFREYYRSDLPLRTRLQYLDFHTFLPDDILTKVDRASMAVGLEVRVPLLATPLVEFAFSLPESVRYTDGQLKGLLKFGYRDVLPRHLLDRRKQGFGMPANLQRSGSSEDNRHWTEVVLTKFCPEFVP